MQNKIEKGHSAEDKQYSADVTGKKNTNVYSNYFEVQLEQSDFGLSRKEHNEICNLKLLDFIKKLDSDKNQFCSEMSNKEIIYQLSTYKSKAPGEQLFTWEHCSSSTANGQMGVMRLVPFEQHKKKKNNPFWKTIHPDYYDRGGYHEWAIPSGAPADISFGDEVNIIGLSAKELPEYFKLAVKANRFDQFQQLLKRAEEVCTPLQKQQIFTQNYTIGKSKKVTTLLHIATKNGYPPMIKAIRSHSGVPLKEQLKKQDQKGNTPAHIAAENNRYLVLKNFKRLGADLAIPNKKQETVLDIVKKRNFSSCLPYASPISSTPEVAQERRGLNKNDTSSSSTPISKQHPTTALKDPQFVYGDMQPKPINGKVSAKEEAGNLTSHHIETDSSSEVTPNMTWREFITRETSRKDAPQPQKVPQSREVPNMTWREFITGETSRKDAPQPQKVSQPREVPNMTWREFITGETSRKDAPQPQVSKEEAHQSSAKELKSESKREERSQINSKAAVHTPPTTKTPTISHQYKPTFFEQKKDNSSLKGEKANLPQEKKFQPEVKRPITPNAPQHEVKKDKVLQTNKPNQSPPKQADDLSWRQQEIQRAQQRAQQQARQQARQQAEQLALQRAQGKARQMAHQQALQQSQQRAQQQSQQREQQQSQQRAQQLAQQRAQQLAQQRAQQLAQQRAAEQARQRAAEQARQQAAQAAAQRAAQQAAAQRAAQQAAAQRAAQQAAAQQAAAQQAAARASRRY